MRMHRALCGHIASGQSMNSAMAYERESVPRLLQVLGQVSSRSPSSDFLHVLLTWKVTNSYCDQYFLGAGENYVA